MAWKKLKKLEDWNVALIGILIIFFLIFGVYLGATYGFKEQNNYPHPTRCFYEWELSYECHNLNGSIVPLIENNQSYWTCSEQDYKVKSC